LDRVSEFPSLALVSQNVRARENAMALEMVGVIPWNGGASEEGECPPLYLVRARRADKSCALTKFSSGSLEDLQRLWR